MVIFSRGVKLKRIVPVISTLTSNDSDYKVECIRPDIPLSLDAARRIVEKLHRTQQHRQAAKRYYLRGTSRQTERQRPEIFEERDRKLEEVMKIKNKNNSKLFLKSNVKEKLICP